MNDMDFVPIGELMINSHKNNLFYLTTYIRFGGSNGVLTLYKNNKSFYCRLNEDIDKKIFAVSRRSINPLIQEMGSWYGFNDKFIAKMPIKVFDKWYDFMLSKPPRSRNSYTRLYFYMYLKIMNCRESWSHSISQLASELDMQRSLVSSRLQELEKEGFIRRGSFIFGDVNLARVYDLPPELM